MPVCFPIIFLLLNLALTSSASGTPLMLHTQILILTLDLIYYTSDALASNLAPSFSTFLNPYLHLLLRWEQNLRSHVRSFSSISVLSGFLFCGKTCLLPKISLFLSFFLDLGYPASPHVLYPQMEAKQQQGKYEWHFHFPTPTPS